MITEETMQKNYAIFLKKMEELGIDSEKITEVFGDSLIKATFAMDAKSGLAYEGSLLNVILRTLTPYALKLNEILPENLKLPKENIVKICLLQHLAKTEMFVKCENDWDIRNGRFYKFNPKNIALRLGARSLALALRLGVTFTDVEIEAMTIVDKDSNDEQAKFFANPISVIVRQANELTTLENIFGQ